MNEPQRKSDRRSTPDPDADGGRLQRYDARQTAESQIPVFDKAGMMSRLMDDKNLVKQVVAVFLDDIPRQIAALKGHLKAGAAAGAERQAHSIKGASANVGGEALYAVTSEMEKKANAGDLAAVTARMPELETQFDLLKEAMEKYLTQG